MIDLRELFKDIESYELLKIQENKLQERQKEIEKLIYQKILFLMEKPLGKRFLFTIIPPIYLQQHQQQKHKD